MNPLDKVKDIDELGEKLKILLASDDRAAQLIKALIFQSLSYASERIPEIADTPKPLDDAMKWGFGHDAGPFEVWDMIGVEETLLKMKDAGFPPAKWVESMIYAGYNKFYQYKGDAKIGVFNPELGMYQEIKRVSSLLFLLKKKP